MQLTSKLETLCAKYDSLLKHEEKQYFDEYKLSLVNERKKQKSLVNNLTSAKGQLPRYEFT